MKSFSKFILVAISISYLFSSCSLIFIPKNQKNIVINTGNKQSEVYVDDLLEGKGSKVNLKKVKKDGAKTVTVRTPLHKDAHFVMFPTKRDPVYWVTMPLDIATFPLMYGTLTALMPVDKYFKYDKVNNFKNTHALPIKQDNHKYIRYMATKLIVKDPSKDFADIVANYNKNDLMGEIKKAESKKYEVDKKAEKNLEKSKKKHVDEDKKAIEYDDTYFSKDIYENLKKCGYIDTTGKVLNNNAKELGLEATIVGGKSYRVISRSTSASLFMVKLDIDWKIKNQYSQVLDSFRISEFSDQFGYQYSKSKETFEKAISDAVNTSFLTLYKNKKFLDYLTISQSSNVAKENISINKPTALVKDAKDALKSAAIIKQKDNKGHGSGFAVSNDGYIITNFHVVSGDRVGQYKDFVVILPDGKEVSAEVVRVDPENDLALVKANATFEKAFLLSDVKSFDILEEVYTVGAPSSVDLGNTVTLGILSNERKGDGVDKIQLNISVSPGNSGGPVFSRNNGVLHGVISSKLVGKFTEGIAFAVPAYNITKYLSINYR